MNLLIKQLGHPDVSVKQMAISILEEISSNTENFKTLIKGSEITPDKRSNQLMMQYLKTDEGFFFLKQLGWVDEQMEIWMNSEKWEYIMKFEKKVIKYLDFETEDTKEKGYQYITYHLSSNLLFS